MGIENSADTTSLYGAKYSLMWARYDCKRNPKLLNKPQTSWINRQEFVTYCDKEKCTTYQNGQPKLHFIDNKFFDIYGKEVKYK